MAGSGLPLAFFEFVLGCVVLGSDEVEWYCLAVSYDGVGVVGSAGGAGVGGFGLVVVFSFWLCAVLGVAGY